MSDPKQGTREARETRETRNPPKRNETVSVDWAEKLKASMNQIPDEKTTETSEYDDLAALLRAQLSKSETEQDPAPVVEWEFDGFDESDHDERGENETYEENDISEENYSREQSDEFDDDPIDLEREHTEESSEFSDSEDDYIDREEVSRNEASSTFDIEIESSDSDEESTNNDLNSEHYSELDIDVEKEQESIQSRVHDSESSSNELLTKEILDRAFGEEFVEIPSRFFEDKVQPISSPPPSPSVMPPIRNVYRRPAMDAWTDDRLNGDTPPTGVGNDHLRDLAMENQRLIAESERPFRDDARETTPCQVTDPTDNSHSLDEPERVSVPENNRIRPAAAPQVYVPLQLGLDDISPTVHDADGNANRKVERTAHAPFVENADAKPSDYTVRMAHNRVEEAALEDTDLFMRMGYEEELRRTDEQSRVERLRVEADEQRREPTFEIPSVQAGEEYRGREDTTRVEEAYARGRRKNTARLIVAAVGALVSLFYDLAPTFLTLFGDGLDAALGTSFGEISLDTVPYYIPAGLVWTLLICLPFLSRLGRGLRSLLNFEPTRYAIASLALLVALVGGCLAWFVGDPYELPLFCGAALFMLMVAALSELLVTEGEYRGFSAVSAGKTSYILTDDPTSASISLEKQTQRDDSSHGEHNKRIFTVVRTGRVADYFARTHRYNPYMGRLNYLLPVALLVAIACAGLELALGGEALSDGVRVFLTAYLICLPSAYLISLTLPLCTANAYLRQKGAAIIGSAAPADYTVKGPAHLIYADGDALKALHRMNITLRGDQRSEEYRHIANVVFRLLNIPLADDPILSEERLDHYRIEISERGEQYLRLYLVDTEKDSATEIMMGSHHALTRRGVRLPRVSMEKQYKKSEGCHVLYLAFNRNFHLAYGVEYRVGRTFGHMVASLNDMGYEVDISTYDPMFDYSMEGLTRLRKRNRVEILCPENFDAIRKVRSGGLVVTGRSLDLQYPLSACRAMLSAYRRGYLCSWLCLPVGVAAVAVAVCFGLTGLLTSALVVLWQLVGVGITLWITLATTLTGIVGRENRKDGKKSSKQSQKKKSPLARR